MENIERLTFEEYACFLALTTSCRSEDPKTKVGAAILNIDKSLASTGYNGFLSKQIISPSLFNEENRVLKGKLIFHAEQNAINFLKDTDVPLIMGLTISPCENCAKTVARAGIKEVVFLNSYHKCDGAYKQIFDFYGVKYKQLSIDSKMKIAETFEKQLKTQLF